MSEWGSIEKDVSRVTSGKQASRVKKLSSSSMREEEHWFLAGKMGKEEETGQEEGVGEGGVCPKIVVPDLMERTELNLSLTRDSNSIP